MQRAGGNCSVSQCGGISNWWCLFITVHPRNDRCVRLEAQLTGWAAAWRAWGLCSHSPAACWTVLTCGLPVVAAQCWSSQDAVRVASSLSCSLEKPASSLLWELLLGVVLPLTIKCCVGCLGHFADGVRVPLCRCDLVCSREDLHENSVSLSTQWFSVFHLKEF